MKISHIFAATLAVFIGAQSVSAEELPPETHTLNFISYAKVTFTNPEDPNRTLTHAVVCPAKLDTGAVTSSIDASDIRHNMFSGMVSFTITGEEGTEPIRFEKPLVRISRTKNRAANGPGRENRFVVEMFIDIAELGPISTEVNLVNRNHFYQRLLIGRTALEKARISVNSKSISDEKKPTNCNVVPSSIATLTNF